MKSIFLMSLLLGRNLLSFHEDYKIIDITITSLILYNQHLETLLKYRNLEECKLGRKSGCFCLKGLNFALKFLYIASFSLL